MRNTSPNGVVTTVMQQTLQRLFKSEFLEREKEKKQARKNRFEIMPKRAPKRHSSKMNAEVCRAVGFEEEYASESEKPES